MLKVLKYLKKTPISVLIIIVLLCVQAMADLALPDYTSKIVNIGIQQGGIKQISPEVIRKSKMEDLLLLTNEDESILENYELISKENLDETEYDEYLEKYPKLETEELYVKKELNDEQGKDLENKMEMPLMAISSLEDEETANNLKNQMLANVPEEQKIALSGMSIIQIISLIVLFFITSKIESRFLGVSFFESLRIDKSAINPSVILSK